MQIICVVLCNYMKLDSSGVNPGNEVITCHSRIPQLVSKHINSV